MSLNKLKEMEKAQSAKKDKTEQTTSITDLKEKSSKLEETLTGNTKNPSGVKETDHEAAFEVGDLSAFFSRKFDSPGLVTHKISQESQARLKVIKQTYKTTIGNAIDLIIEAFWEEHQKEIKKAYNKTNKNIFD